MDFIVSKNNDIAIITTKVEKLNTSNSSSLKAELVLLGKENFNKIVIDMSFTKYCDSSGLSAILIANRMCKDNGGQFYLCGLMPNVQKLIEIAQLDRVLKISPNQEDALAKI
ncbi:MAG: anti-anti-sigma factor [Crocinitomicaceae bacterium]|nr:anti-anti-sigma factor [Crocinitomicaceae bacterium]|tara:strand:+ start:39175 stop:39510 length:336 start_codon:yes stop_codon:yes gene_type:complete